MVICREKYFFIFSQLVCKDYVFVKFFRVRNSIFRSFRSLQKIDRDCIDLSIAKNNRFDREKKSIFRMFFDSFPPFLCQKIESLPSIFDFFLKIDTIDSLSSIFRSVDHKKDRFDRKTDYRIPNTEIFKKQCTT